MAERWSRTTGQTQFEVCVGPEFEIEFSASGPGDERTGLQGESESIWLEEFPDNDRWQEWVRERLGEEVFVEVQNEVASRLEDLATDRKQEFASAVEGLYSGGSVQQRRAIDRVRSLAQRYEDLAGYAVEELADLLEDEEGEARRRSAEALRRIADERPEYVEDARPDLERALGDDHPNVRLDAARTLVTLAAPEGEEPDMEMLERVVETLVGLLHEHTRWFSRGPVAGLLGELGREHPDAIEPAVEPLARFVVGDLSSGSGTSGIGRSTAVQAIVEIGRADIDAIVDHADALFEELDSSRPGVRGHCAEGLGLVGEHVPDLAERTAEALEGLLDDREFVRSSAVDALQQIRSESPEAVERALSDQQLELLEEDEPLPI